MKFGIFALLFLLFSVTAQEIGFPDGKYKGPWNVEIGQEFGGTLTRCYPVTLPDNKPAVCLQPMLGKKGTYCSLNRRVPQGSMPHIEIEVARGDFRALRLRFLDEKGQTFLMQYDLKGDPKTIQKITCSLANGKRIAVYGGAADGEWRGKLVRLSLLADSSVADSKASAPKIYFRSIRLINSN